MGPGNLGCRTWQGRGRGCLILLLHWDHPFAERRRKLQSAAGAVCIYCWMHVQTRHERHRVFLVSFLLPVFVGSNKL